MIGREARRGDLDHVELWVTGRPLERKPVGAARHRGRRGEDPDPVGIADRGGDLGLGLDHRQHLDAMLRRHGSDDVPTSGGRRVACHHEQLRTPVEQEPHQLLDPRPQPLAGLVAVREPRRVAEIEVVLLRQGDQQLVEDRQAADPRIEHRDRQAGALVAHRCVVGSIRRQGLTTMKKIVTATISPASCPTRAICADSALYSVLSSPPAARSRSESSIALRVRGWK